MQTRDARRALRLADRWFRIAGTGTLAALAVTGAMLALDASEWRVPFVLAHLGALSGLLPLALVLVATTAGEAYAEQRTLGGALRGVLTRDRVATVLVAIFLAGVVVSLSQFQDGIRWLRTVANLTAVSCALLLIGRYLRG